MSIEERIHGSLVAVADDITPPLADVNGIRAGAQRRRRGTRVGVVAAVAALIALSALVPGLARSKPQPTTPFGTLPGAVWYDADGLHHGATVRPLAIDDAPLSLALVRDGVLYCDPATRMVWYQPWVGRPSAVGHSMKESQYVNGICLGPAGDPDGTTAAWFDHRQLVMYDTATGATKQLGRQPEPALFRENTNGNKVFYVDADRVVWAARPGILSYDVSTNTTTQLSTWDPPVVYDVYPGYRAVADRSTETTTLALRSDDGRTYQATNLDSDVARFSPDGRYLAYITADQNKSYGPVVVDTSTFNDDNLADDFTYPTIGWGYHDILMDLQSGITKGTRDTATLRIYNAATHDMLQVTPHGDVVLPNN
jgi:hypothetical protein